MKPEDLHGMKFNPLVRDKGKYIWQIYPDLATRKDFTDIPRGLWGKEEANVPSKDDLDDVLRWTIMFCTKDGNPLARELDFDARKQRCFDELNLKPSYFSVQLIENWHQWVVNIMAVYMRMVDNEKYNRWVSMKVAHDQNMQYLMTNPIYSDDPEKMMALKEKISKSLGASAKALKELEASLFPDEQTKDILNEYQTLLADGPGGFADYFVAQDYDQYMKNIAART